MYSQYSPPASIPILQLPDIDEPSISESGSPSKRAKIDQDDGLAVTASDAHGIEGRRDCERPHRVAPSLNASPDIASSSPVELLTGLSVRSLAPPTDSYALSDAAIVDTTWDLEPPGQPSLLQSPSSAVQTQVSSNPWSLGDVAENRGSLLPVTSGDGAGHQVTAALLGKFNAGTPTDCLSPEPQPKASAFSVVASWGRSNAVLPEEPVKATLPVAPDGDTAGSKGLSGRSGRFVRWIGGSKQEEPEPTPCKLPTVSKVGGSQTLKVLLLGTAAAWMPSCCCVDT